MTVPSLRIPVSIPWNRTHCYCCHDEATNRNSIGMNSPLVFSCSLLRSYPNWVKVDRNDEETTSIKVRNITVGSLL